MKTRDRQVLHAMDLCILRHSQAAGAIGCRGLNVQVQVWLCGRVDPSVLRAALDRVGRAHPVLTSCLVEEPRRGRAHWQFRPGAACVLHETSLAAGGEAAALGHAARILAAAADPAETDPVAFHLLHLPDGRDVLLMQHDHCLMDIHGTNELLRQVGRPQEEVPAVAPEGEEDGTRAYLRRFSFGQRWRAVWRYGSHLQPFQRSTPLTLSDAVAPVRGGDLRIAVRELDARRTRAFLERTTRLCGFPSPSVALLASIFRGILRHTPHPVTEKSALFTNAGTNLRRRGERGPIFRNLGSLISLIARPEDMELRDKLVLLLGRQMREQTSRGIDLAVLQWVWWLRQCTGFWRRHSRQSLHHHCLNYGYMGRLVEDGDRFCGVPVERQFAVTQTWSPPGLSVTPALCGGRLILPVSYMADTVPEARLQAFLDTVVADLTE